MNILFRTAGGVPIYEQIFTQLRDSGEIIKNHLGKITKSEIMAKCPDISQITVQRTLAELLKSGEIIKLSGGRYTSYTWNRERE